MKAYCTQFPPVAQVHRSVAMLLIILAAVAAAPMLATFDPDNIGAIDLADARLPPLTRTAANRLHILGTDGQGRDILSGVLHGTRQTLTLALFSVLAGGCAGVAAGFLAALGGRFADAVIGRACDIQLAYPALLVALLFDGLARTAVAGRDGEVPDFWIVAIALAFAIWPHFARTVRALAAAELAKPYILAAVSIGLRDKEIVVRHIWPNIRGQVIVLGTWMLTQAVACEATLSFLGVGTSSTSPSLGTMIRIGHGELLSGAWWIAGIPMIVLVALVTTIALISDRLRDEIDPVLRSCVTNFSGRPQCSRNAPSRLARSAKGNGSVSLRDAPAA